MKWTNLLARLALVLLALAASYGVWDFQRLFVPAWVALVSAAAFEATYIALAFARTVAPRRAVVVSVAAVAASVAYNSLAALFTRRPALLDAPPLWADVALAALHGAPLAVVAYNVAALLHDHRDPLAELRGRLANETQMSASLRAELAETRAQLAAERERPVVLRVEDAARLLVARGAPESTIRTWIDTGRLQIEEVSE